MEGPVASKAGAVVLHHGHELLERDNAVAVEVGFLHHLPDLRGGAEGAEDDHKLVVADDAIGVLRVVSLRASTVSNRLKACLRLVCVNASSILRLAMMNSRDDLATYTVVVDDSIFVNVSCLHHCLSLVLGYRQTAIDTLIHCHQLLF